jgi:flagellin-like protein
LLELCFLTLILPRGILFGCFTTVNISNLDRRLLCNRLPASLIRRKNFFGVKFLTKENLNGEGEPTKMFNFRKIRKNVKAISPVISVLLMIAVAVVASLVAYAWVMGYIGVQTDKTGQAIQIQSMANATVLGTPGRLVIYVQNIGTGSVNVNPQSVYVNNAQVSTNMTGSITIPAQSTLTIGTTYSLITTGTQSATVTAKVTTEGGTFSQVTESFP